MKFRNEEFTEVAVYVGSAEEVKKGIKQTAELNTIVDVQYGFALDQDGMEFHSALILYRV